ncbi:MAG TPA: lysylphosphatidylglycerol synthase transmembrane domain-containing protein [Gaiellaceae bacterium]|nr:lysylphosphatidylglycerol synthase transmembrane domain-containing protein [Gaiellaceae bacterium]
MSEGLSIARRKPVTTAVFWLSIAVSALLGFLALRNAHPDQVWEALRSSTYVWLAPAFAVFSVGIFLRAVRWRFLFHRSTRPSLGATSSAMLIGYLFNNILPLRAGEAARIVALKQSAGVSRSESTATVVLERAYDVLTLLVLLLALQPWLPDVSWLRAAAVFALVLALGLATAAVVLLVWGVRPLRFLLRPLARLPFLDDDRLDSGAESLARGLAGSATCGSRSCRSR